jgi:hypothetical protein
MLDCLYFSSTSLGKLSATGQLGEVNVIKFLLRNRYLPLHRRLILIHKYPQESQGRKLFFFYDCLSNALVSISCSMSYFFIFFLNPIRTIVPCGFCLSLFLSNRCNNYVFLSFVKNVC